MADKPLICRTCEQEFLFTEGEQEFYKEKGFENEPKDCKPCRASKKQERRGNRGNRNKEEA